MVRTS